MIALFAAFDIDAGRSISAACLLVMAFAWSWRALFRFILSHD